MRSVCGVFVRACTVLGAYVRVVVLESSDTVSWEELIYFQFNDTASMPSSRIKTCGLLCVLRKA